MQLPSFTPVVLISSICPSFRMRRLAVSVTILPFLYQVMLGGGTALVSHCRVNDFPTRVFTTTGEPPLLSLMLGGTKRQRAEKNPPFIPRSHTLCTHCGCGLTEYCEVNVSVSLSGCIHGHTAVLSTIRNFCFHNLKRTTTSKQTKKTHSERLRLFKRCPHDVPYAHHTGHYESICVGLNGPSVIQPAQGGRGETSSLTWQRNKVVHHNIHPLRVQANDDRRHWKEKRNAKQKTIIQLWSFPLIYASHFFHIIILYCKHLHDTHHER